MADLLNARLHLLPLPLVHGALLPMARCYQEQFLNALFTTTPESQPALPFHLVLEIPKYESTFDNSLGRKLLDYEPEESWEDALEWIALEYRARHPHSFSKKLSAQNVASR
jgi:hypothetical protein